MPRITALEIENFQSIKNSMRVEFAPITLLFGPNSAGKSAVFDALDLVEMLWDPTKFDQNTAQQMVERWSRREDGKHLPMRVAVEFEYAIEEAYSSDVWDDDRNWLCNKPRSKNSSFIFTDDSIEDCPEDYSDLVKTIIKLEFKIEFIDGNDRHSKVPIVSSLSVANREKIILGYGIAAGGELEGQDFDFLSMSYDGLPVFLSKESPFFSHVMGELVKNTKAKLKDKDGFRARVLIPRLNFSEVASVSHYFYTNESVDQMPALIGYENAFTQNVSDILFYFGSVVARSFRNSSPIVKADRRIPTPSEALFVIDPKLSGWWNAKDRFSANSPARLLDERSASADPHYHLIAKTAHASLLLKTAKDDFWGSGHALKYLAEDLKSEVIYIDKINEHLEKNLFNEKLYKVECASTLMVPIDLNEDDPWSYYALAQPSAVRLFLKDGEGRNVELQDVGSGIPFVLPVLYASVAGALGRVQQPELHLHPALQSELADVFLCESIQNKEKLFIIETHSEHLMLRMLRRMRDTENDRPSSKELPLTPKDIAIYYFEPQVTGGTYVIKQAVTPLGDFYHDWPRGFFADRDKDLFE